MEKLAVSLAILTFIIGCGHPDTPDVSNISVNISIERFDKAFFEKADTNNTFAFTSRLQQQFPWFAGDFFANIIGVEPDSCL